jgi:succinate dehydrogenase / fumarate reductase, membrane anchor subunit
MGSGTRIGKVRGLGSARNGGKHWISAMTSSVASLLLSIWLVASLLLLPDFDRATVAQWLTQPSVAVPMILTVAAFFWHTQIGLTVLIEDYVHDEGLKLGTIMLLNFYAVAGTVLGIFLIARIAFAGAAA